MATWLITGSGGFVAGHLVRLLRETARDAEIWGIDGAAATAVPAQASSARVRPCDVSLSDVDGLVRCLERIRPTRIVHLAAQSSVAASWKDPVGCFVNNTNIFLNLIEAARLARSDCRILSVGSSEEYGPRTAAEMPLRETVCPAPANPYAVARVAQEQLSRVYAASYGLPIVCTRSFNHVGPDQRDGFVVSSFCRQAVEVSLGLRSSLQVGDLRIVRDFIDVRDVVRAYVMLVERGEPGTVYNVCSGRATALEQLVALVRDAVGVELPVTVDHALLRPVDNPVIVGDGSRLAAMGFRPAVPLEQSVREQVETWRRRLSPTAPGHAPVPRS